MIKDMTPKPLYVYRKVKNADEIIAWAKSQGFETTLPAGDMHVTITFSKSPVDWFKMGEAWDAELTVNEGGARAVEVFGGGAKVLQFASSELAWRNVQMRENGASYDFEEYRPHITISYGDAPSDVAPYQGKIVLGPEIFEEINLDWKPSIVEDTLRGNTNGCIIRDMKTNFTDRASIGDIKTTQEGHISTIARAVRTGIQEYTGAELGLIGRDIVRVYRPAEEVFSADSLQSFSHATVTINHPPVLVDADNWKEYAAGEVSTAAMRDGEWVALPLMLKDAAAIAAVNSGKVELSAGYTAEIELVDGVTVGGEPYDAIQRNIRINHLALVDKARAGSQARIGDSAENWGAAPITKKEEVKMTDLKTVVIGDKAVQVAAADADTITKLIADHKAAVESKDEEIGKLKAECADTAKKVLDADAIDAMVQSRVAVIDKARAMVTDYDASGKSVEDIRREVVKSVHGDEAAAETVTDAEIKGIFDFATAKPADDKMRKALGDAKPQTQDPWADIIKKKDAK